MLKINIKSKKFDELELYKDVNISLGNGLYILQGENGTGKTTLFNILYRLDDNYSGEVLFENQNIKDMDISDYRTNYITYVNQEFNLFTNLTPKENIDLLSKNKDKEKYAKLVKGLNLKEVVTSNKKIKKLSGGQIQKVKLLIGLMSNTPILLLDEPDNNLDIEAVEFLASYLIQEKRLLIVSSHTFDEFINKDSTSILQIDNKTIKFIHEIQLINNELKVNDTNKLQLDKSIIKKMSTRFRIQRYLMYTISLILILISLLITLNMYKTIEEAMESAPYVIDDNVVEIYAPIINSLFFQLEDEQVVETTAYYFTHDDYEKIQSMDNVKYVSPRGDFFWNTYDTAEYYIDQEIDLTALNYSKYNALEYESEGTAKLEQDNCVETKRINEHGTSTCGYGDKLLYGSYPEDNTNQVLVDPYIAMYYAEQNNFDSMEDVIGKKVTVEVSHTNIAREKSINDYTVVISGIIDFNINDYTANEEDIELSKQEHTVYFIPSFQSGNFSDAANHPWTGIDYTLDDNKSAQEIVKEQIQSRYEAVGLEVPTMDEIPPIKDNAYPGFYIELNSAEDVPAFTDTIKEYDPYIYINSNYTNQNTNNFLHLKTIIIKDILFIIGDMLFIIILLILLAKYYKKNLQQEMSKLEYFGFNKEDIEKYKKVNNYKIYIGILIEFVILLIVLIVLYFIYLLAVSRFDITRVHFIFQRDFWNIMKMIVISSIYTLIYLITVKFSLK